MKAIRLLAVMAAVPAVLALGATAASAHVLPHTQTRITDRPDGGNGSPPYWADDNFTRDLVITPAAGNPATCTVSTPCSYTAVLTDNGTFTTIKGEQTPNQGPGYTGDVIESRVTGTMTGYADFSFTATSAPSTAPNQGVPVYVNDHNTAPSGVTLGTDAGTSGWYELAFPSGTAFGGTGIGDWSWKYDASIRTVTYRTTYRTIWTWKHEHHHWVRIMTRVRIVTPVIHTVHQQWTDASSNGDGNLAGDGNITG